MKKKKSLTLKDKKDWIEFTKNPSDLFDKDINNYKKEERNYSIKKLDLHGYTLDEAQVKVRELINESIPICLAAEITYSLVIESSNKVILFKTESENKKTSC